MRISPSLRMQGWQLRGLFSGDGKAPAGRRALAVTRGPGEPRGETVMWEQEDLAC